MLDTEMYEKILDSNYRSKQQIDKNNREIFSKYLKKSSKRVLYIKNELIIGEHQQSDKFYLVDRGKVINTRIDVTGKEYTTGYTLPREFFGFSSIKNLPEVTNYRALTNCNIYEVEISIVNEILKENEEFRRQFEDILVNTMRISNIRNSNLIIGGCRMSFVNFIIEHVDDFSKFDESGNILVNLDVNLADIARILNMTRETLSRIVTQMRNEGIVDNKRRLIKIKDMRRFILGV